MPGVLRPTSMNARRWAGRSSVRRKYRDMWHPPDRTAANPGRTTFAHADFQGEVAYARSQNLHRIASHAPQAQGVVAELDGRPVKLVYDDPTAPRAELDAGTLPAALQGPQLEHSRTLAPKNDAFNVGSSMVKPTSALSTLPEADDDTKVSAAVTSTKAVSTPGGQSASATGASQQDWPDANASMNTTKTTAARSQFPEDENTARYELTPSVAQSSVERKGKEREPRYEGHHDRLSIEQSFTAQISSLQLSSTVEQHMGCEPTITRSSTARSEDLDEFHDSVEWLDAKEWSTSTIL